MAIQKHTRLNLFFTVIGISSLFALFGMFKLDSYAEIKLPSPRVKRKMFKYKDYVTNNTKLDIVADPIRSKLTITGGNKTFSVGDKLVVLISLCDKDGRYLTEGGDVLRIWLKEGNSNVNGEIQDNGDGTYTGTVLLPWRGTPTLYVSIANTRQQLKYVVSSTDKYGLLYGITAKFINTQSQVTITPCSPRPKIQGWKEVCNLTNMNYNVLWYSGKPTNPNISCSDWKLLKQEFDPYLHNNQIEWIRKHKQMILKPKITIEVKGEKDVITTKDQYCHSINRSLTWIQNSPSGFYYNGSWVNPWCRTKIKKLPKDYTKCLRNRHFLMIGDSNIRSFTSYLQSFLRLKTRTGFMLAGKPWQQFVYAERPDQNISVAWAAHETPFFSRPYYEKELLKPSFVRLDEIGRNNNSIVLIHIYFHLARTTPDVFRRDLKRLRISIENVWKRSPNVDVLIKGPHASTYRLMVDPIDFLSSIQWQIWQEEFKGLYHKVIYLDMWDITSGSESVNSHPNSRILSDMILTFFSYICK